jgi:hypothetical protein
MKWAAGRKTESCKVHLILALMFFGFSASMIDAQKCSAESAGELGLHYGVRYYQPVVIGPLRDMRLNFHIPSLSPESDSIDTETPAVDESFDFLRAESDFDEYIYSSNDYGDLYSSLHKKGGRISYQISPLMKIPLNKYQSEVKKQSPTRRKK